MTVHVVAPPTSGPPIVTILSHQDDDGLDSFATAHLRATAVDPDHAGPIQLEWYFTHARKTIFLGNTQPPSGRNPGILLWRPADDYSENSGVGKGTLTVEAIDADRESSSASVAVRLIYPPS